jgi:hypothetical protein
MTYVTVEVDVDLDEFGDEEIVRELKARGYYVQKKSLKEVMGWDDKLDDDDLDLLLELVDKNNNNVYTNRVRDKLHRQRRY